ncbi:hypothetical protein GGU10DRAFT_382126 [Lentinula aff. detonsa]|uniref:Uncharacterized protein n=1 Tax=Lentinula aff. detonsa TaxID=2804958 RepID=A0AA38KMF0_9AGAR|nr:hypothetical protein GGU10DRAFT_382126 [Lentinula aff. detonsa]
MGLRTYCDPVKAMQPERIMIEVPGAPDEVSSVGTVAVTQGDTRKGYMVLGSVPAKCEEERSSGMSDESDRSIWM